MSLEWYCANLGYYENGREMFMSDIPSQAAAFLSLFCILDSHKWSSRVNSKRSQTIRVCRLLASPLLEKQAAGSLEDNITHHGRNAFVLKRNGGVQPRIERRAEFGVVGICLEQRGNG